MKIVAAKKDILRANFQHKKHTEMVYDPFTRFSAIDLTSSGKSQIMSFPLPCRLHHMLRPIIRWTDI